MFQQLNLINPNLALYDTSENNSEILVDKLNEPLDLKTIQTEWRQIKILINDNDKTKLLLLAVDEFWYTISKLKDYSDTYQYLNTSKLAKIF